MTYAHETQYGKVKLSYQQHSVDFDLGTCTVIHKMIQEHHNIPIPVNLKELIHLKAQLIDLGS